MGLTPPTPSIHRLQRGLPGYLIPFAPHAFAHERQVNARVPLSPLVFLQISTHSTTTPGIPYPSHRLKLYSFQRPLPVKPGAFHAELVQPPARALRPVIPDNARHLRITAAAGT